MDTDLVWAGRDLWENVVNHQSQLHRAEGLSEKCLSLQAESSKSITSGASWDERKSRFRAQAFPRQARGAPLSLPPAASPRPVTPSTRQRQGTFGKDEYRTSKAAGTPQSKQKSSTGKTRIHWAMLNTVHALSFFVIQLSWACNNIARVLRRV